MAAIREQTVILIGYATFMVGVYRFNITLCRGVTAEKMTVTVQVADEIALISVL